MQEDELKRLLKETIDYPPSKTTLDIYSFQNEHRTSAIKGHGNYIKYFEVYYDLLNLVIQKLNYAPKDKWPHHKGLQYLMYPETMKTLHRSFEDIINGYYDEATILLRCIFEYYVRMIYIAAHPTNMFDIFSVIKGRGKLNITNFLRNDLKLSWHDLYRTMSTIAHSKAHKILRKYVELSKGSKEPISLVFAYSEHDLSTPMNISTFLLYLLLHLLVVSFKNDLVHPCFSKEEIDRIHKTDTALRGILEALPNEFPNWVKEIDKIDHLFE